ncbi:hypothetical protein [Succinivibrio dextrinosolvens]|uniref:hypothetical protein n=1 Tax=Succinivibrio dextrinosolvens TaxID=83771 RepID=UPI0004E19440|nr:hypothetical protein [Succinivibrio dextrinosolvens]
MSDPKLNGLSNVSQNIINNAELNTVKNEEPAKAPAPELQNAKKGSIGWKIFNITMTIMTGGLYGIAWGIYELGSYFSNAKKGNRTEPLTQKENTGNPNGIEFGKNNQNEVKSAPAYALFETDVSEIEGSNQNITSNFRDLINPTYDDNNDLKSIENTATYKEFKEQCKELVSPLETLFDKFKEQYQESGINKFAKGVKAKIGNDYKETLFNCIKKRAQEEGRIVSSLLKLQVLVENNVPQKVEKFLDIIEKELMGGAEQFIRPKAQSQFKVPDFKGLELSKEHQKLEHIVMYSDNAPKEKYEDLVNNKKHYKVGIAMQQIFAEFTKTFGLEGVKKIISGLGLAENVGNIENDEDCESALYQAMSPDSDQEPGQTFLYSEMIKKSGEKQGPSSQDLIDFMVERLNMLAEKFELKPLEVSK